MMVQLDQTTTVGMDQRLAQQMGIQDEPKKEPEPIYQEPEPVQPLILEEPQQEPVEKKLVEDVPPPPVPAAPGSTIEVTVEKGSAKLGMDVDYGDGVTLRVTAVKDGSIVAAWNSANPTKLVEKDDLILEINGVAGDASKLLEKILGDKTLEMKLQKAG